MVGEAELDEWAVTNLNDAELQWVKNNDFTAKLGSSCIIPADNGTVAKILCAASDNHMDFWSYGELAAKMPAGNYEFATEIAEDKNNILIIAINSDEPPRAIG